MKNKHAENQSDRRTTVSFDAPNQPRSSLNLPCVVGLGALVALAVLLLAGCETLESKGNSGGKQVEVFRDGKEPSRPYTVLESIADDGREEEEPTIEAKMIKKAQRLGADAILFEPKKESGYEATPIWWGGVKKTYLYKAKAVKYQ
ncbi:MAG: hypothetical protein HYY24_11880 [Verrucomicrobia bacterium]|nr:hypothetical protein [Verrucomicrobiota bacterium]